VTLIATKGGTTQYFVFLPKVHIICLVLVIDRRFRIGDKEEERAQVMISHAHVSPDQTTPARSSIRPHMLQITADRSSWV
jgi:hypothetical protein